MKNQKAIALCAVAIAAVVIAAGLFMTVGSGNDQPVYNIEYNTNGGDAVKECLTYQEDSDTFNLPICVRADYTFIGWYDNPDFNGEKITFIEHGSKGDIRLWAKWQLEKKSLPTAEEIMSNTDINTTFDNASDPEEKIINKEIVSAITEGKKLTVTNIDANNKVILSMTFDGSKATDGYTPGNVSVNVTPDKSKIASEKEIVLEFTHSGKLPYATTITFYVGLDDFDAGTLLDVKNDADGKSIGQYPVDEHGYITFEIDHCSNWILKKWVTLTFDANGGIFEDGQKTFVSGKKYRDSNDGPEIPVPNWPGYRFSKWVGTSEGNKYNADFDPYEPYSKDASFKASWVAVDSTITFVYGNGLSDESMSYNIDNAERVILPLDKTVEGMKIVAWYLTPDFSGEPILKLDRNAYGDKTLYGMWAYDEYTVTYDCNGGTITQPSLTVTYNGTYSGLLTPSKLGYTFGGWYLEKSLITEIKEGTPVAINEDHTIYAKWTPTVYTLAYHFGDRTELVEYTIENLPYDLDRNFTKEGYTFGGWYDNPNCDGREIRTIDEGAVGFYDLYIKWIPNKFKVTYNVDGGMKVYPSFAEVTYGEPYPELATPTRTGYVFDGWYVDSQLKNKITDETLVKTNGQHTIYAKWIPNTYRVTYELNGGDLDKKYVEIKYGQNYIQGTSGLETPTRTGYVFCGWYLDPGFINKIELTTLLTIDSDHTVYAKWAQSIYSITYHTEGGEPITGYLSYTSDDESIILPTPKRSGYIFGGWYENDALIGEPVQIISSGSTGDREYWAKWDIAYLTLNITLNGQNYDANEVKFVGKNVIFEKVAVGVYRTQLMDEILGINLLTVDGINGGTVDVNKIPQITDVEFFTVTFDSNGGSTVSEQIVIKGGYVASPVVNKTGYSLVSWLFGSNYVLNAWTFASNIVNGHVSLIANWAANEYLVTYDLNGGESFSVESEYVTYDSNYNSYDDPDWFGYAFTGWYLDRECTIPADEKVNIAEDHTLYAGWVRTIFTVSFDTGTEEELEDKTYMNGVPLELPEVEREGYIFLGWSDGIIEPVMVFSEEIHDDIELFAVWYEVDVTITITLNGEPIHATVRATKGDIIVLDEDAAKYALIDKDKTGRVVLTITVPGYNAWKGTFETPEYPCDLEIKLFTVTFMINEEVYSKSVVMFGETIATPYVLPSIGFFASWYYIENGVERPYESVAIQKETVVTLRWIRDNSTYHILLSTTEDDGLGPAGTWYQQGVNVKCGDNLPKMTFEITRNGYIFDGFQYNGVKYYDRDGNGLRLWDIANNVTMTPVWIPIKCKATVTLLEGDSQVAANGWTYEGGVYTKEFDYRTTYAAILEDFGDISFSGSAYSLVPDNYNEDQLLQVSGVNFAPSQAVQADQPDNQSNNLNNYYVWPFLGFCH